MKDSDADLIRRCSRSPSPCEKSIHRHQIDPSMDVPTGSPYTLLERERTRRYGSGGSSSSSGLSMDTGSGSTTALPTANGSDVFTRIRDLSEERVDGVASSSGEEEQRVSDMEQPTASTTTKSSSSASKKSKKNKKKKSSKLSGSSDSGVSDVSTNEPLPSSVQASSIAVKSSSLPTPSSTTPTRESSKAAVQQRPSRRVSRLSTDSSGDGNGTKHSLPRIIPWEVETPTARKAARQQGDGSSSRPGTPLCDENDEPPTDPRTKERPKVERPMSLPLPRFGLELNLSRTNNKTNATSSTSSSSSGTTPSTDGTFRIPHPHGTSVSPSRAAAVPGSPRGAPEQNSASSTQLVDSSSDSECSSGSSPRASLSTTGMSLAEQLRQWEQRYEQWSTRSAHSSGDSGPVAGQPSTPTIAAQPTTVATVTAAAAAAAAAVAAERYRTRKARPMSLEELKSQEPSDIVRCLLAKHSVFDEDLKRLESSGRETTTTPTLSTPPVAVNKESKSKSVATVNHQVSVPTASPNITKFSPEVIKSPVEPPPPPSPVAPPSPTTRTPSPAPPPPLPKESPPPSPPPPPVVSKEPDVTVEDPAEPMDEDLADELVHLINALSDGGDNAYGID